jgi:hypothetical protein
MVKSILSIVVVLSMSAMAMSMSELRRQLDSTTGKPTSFMVEWEYDCMPILPAPKN